MEILGELAAWLEATLLPYGGIGLMLLAICDSSFLSLPEVNDILLMTFSIRQPDRMLMFAGLTTVGSVIGCSMLYAVGRGSGMAFLDRRVGLGESTARMQRIHSWYEKYGVLAVIVPSLLPPPTPFKIFVLSAGTFGISWPKFLVAVATGRGIRYFSQGVLSVMYGEAAIAFVQRNYPMIGMALSIAVVMTVVAFVIYRRRQGVTG
jgi:membrane protein YqaA with SNARE-associated domain